jgi:hypothetical protein
MRRTGTALLALAAVALTAAPAAADPILWIGPGSGNWTSSSSWSSNTVPGSLDDVTLGLLPSPNQGNSYTVTVNSPQAANSLTINAGTATLSGVPGTGNTFTVGTLSMSAGAFNQQNGILSVGTMNLTGGTFTLSSTGTVALGAGGGTVSGSGTFAFSNGTLGGAALTVNNGGYTWDNGTLLTAVNLNAGGGLISGLGTKILGSGAQLNINVGTTSFVGVIKYSGAGSVTIANGATMSMQSDIDVTKDTAYSGSAPFTVQTGGTLVKALGTGVAQFHAGLTITNAGMIRTSSAILEFDSGIANTGTLQADTGAELRLVGGTFTLSPGSVIAGGGTVHLLGATSTAAVIDVQANTAVAPTLSLDVGTVQGTQTLTVNGPLTWKQGVVGGSVTLKAIGGGSIIGSAVITTGTVDLAAGTYTWSAGNLTFNGNGLLMVDPGATLAASNGSGSLTVAYSSGTPVIQNNGIVSAAVSGTGVLTIQNGITLNNAGTLRATTGGITVQGTVNNTGTIDLAASSPLTVGANGLVTLSAGSVFTGTGPLVVGTSSGTLTVNTAVTTPGGLKFTNGTINGTGILTVNGSFDWGVFDTNGVQGSVTIQAAGGGDWTLGGTKRIGSGTVNLSGGTANWNNADIGYGAGGGALIVGSGATLNLTGDRSFVLLSGASGSPSFTNNGIFQKTGGAGTSTINSGIAFTNGGLTDVESGTLIIHAATTNTGLIKAGGTGTLLFDQAVTLSGSGTFNVVAGGTLTVNASGATITIPSGATFSNAGIVQVTAGTLAIPSGAILNNYTPTTATLSGGTWLATNSTIDLGGRAVGTIDTGTTVELSGSSAVMTGLTSLTQNNGNLRIYSGATLTPTGTVNNAGMIEVSGTLGTAVVVQSGGTLAGQGTVNGSVTAQSGGKLTPGPGPYAASGAGVLTVGNTALNGGSTYVWELNSWSATPSAGTNFDQLKGISGAKLSLAGASSGSPVVLKITSLNGSSPGQIPNFDPTQGRSWVIADFSNGNASGGVQSFSPDRVTLDTSAFANGLGGGSFSLSLDANSNLLILTFSPVPEPGSVLLVAAAAVAGLWRRRRAACSP